MDNMRSKHFIPLVLMLVVLCIAATVNSLLINPTQLGYNNSTGSLYITNGVTLTNASVNGQTNIDLTASKIVLTGTGKKLISSAYGESDLTAGINSIGRNADRGTNTTLFGNANGTNALYVSAAGLIYSNSVVGLSVDSKGQVGVGTATPGAGLHVKSSQTYVQKLESPTVDLFAQFVTTSGSGEFGIFDDAIYFQAINTLANGIRFYPASGNNVSLGLPANGEAIFSGLARITNGIASYATDAVVNIAATGWTNTFGKNAVVYLDGTAVTFSVKNSAGTSIYTNAVSLTGEATVILQPGGAVITSGTGVTGRATPF